MTKTTKVPPVDLVFRELARQVKSGLDGLNLLPQSDTYPYLSDLARAIQKGDAADSDKIVVLGTSASNPKHAIITNDMDILKFDQWRSGQYDPRTLVYRLPNEAFDDNDTPLKTLRAVRVVDFKNQFGFPQFFFYEDEFNPEEPQPYVPKPGTDETWDLGRWDLVMNSSDEDELDGFIIEIPGKIDIVDVPVTRNLRHRVIDTIIACDASQQDKKTALSTIDVLNGHQFMHMMRQRWRHPDVPEDVYRAISLMG